MTFNLSLNIEIDLNSEEVVVDFAGERFSCEFSYDGWLWAVKRKIQNGLRFEDIEGELYEGFIDHVQKCLNKIKGNDRVNFLLETATCLDAKRIIDEDYIFDDLLEKLSRDLKSLC